MAGERCALVIIDGWGFQELDFYCYTRMSFLTFACPLARAGTLLVSQTDDFLKTMREGGGKEITYASSVCVCVRVTQCRVLESTSP